MDITKAVLVALWGVATEGPLGILALIIAVSGSLVFQLLQTRSTGTHEDHKLRFLTAIVTLTIVFVVTLLLIVAWD